MTPEQALRLIERKMKSPKLHIGLKRAIHHSLTCGDLSHGHGVVRIKWDNHHS